MLYQFLNLPLLVFCLVLCHLNLSHSTIKLYLSGVQSLHITHGPSLPFNRHPTHTQATSHRQTTWDIPRNYYPNHGGNQIYPSKNPYNYHNIMMWEACRITFFGFYALVNSLYLRRKLTMRKSTSHPKT